MKKLLMIMSIIITVMLIGAINVKAASNTELINTVYNIGSKYGLTSADKVKIERYLADNPVTEQEADSLISKAEEIDAIMKEAGVTDPTKLSQADKDRIQSIANEAASVLKVSLVIKNGNVEIYKDGKLIENVSINNGKLAYTGNNNYVIFGISAVAIVALVIVCIMKKEKLMHKRLINIIKATIIEIIVAFLLVVLSIIILEIAVGQEKETAITLINAMSLNKENVIINKPVLEGNIIKNYPEYGSKYAKIQIPKININLDVYYGDTMEILKKGVGHSSGSYFPGEGGSIIYMGHNSKNVFRGLSKISKGDSIQITTEYGEFKYQVYDMKIVNETDLELLPIQKEKEILMLYTCYPFQNIGYTTQRYVVYAEKIEED